MDEAHFDLERCEAAGVTPAEADCLVFIKDAGQQTTQEIRRRYGPVVGRGIREKGFAEPRGVKGPAQPGDPWVLTAAGAEVLAALRDRVKGEWPRAAPPGFLPAPRAGQFVRVRIEHMAAYRARHGLHIVRGYWESGAAEPTLEVE